MDYSNISSVVIKLAELCNLKCSYCYLYQKGDSSFLKRPKFISNEVFVRAIRALRTHSDRFSLPSVDVAFHGGEPLLIGPARLDYLSCQTRSILGERLGSLSLQTNATLISDDFIQVFRKHGINVSISMDGPARTHDLERVDHRGNTSHWRVLHSLKMLRQNGINPAVLCVINPDVNGSEIYDHFRELEFTAMDFLFPDTTHDLQCDQFFKTSTPIADYLIPIFNQWYGEDNPSVIVRLFWELINLILFGTSDAEIFSNAIPSYVVIETDGSIQAMDVLRICDPSLSDSGLNVLVNEFHELGSASPFVRKLLSDGIPAPIECRNCSEFSICGGGLLPHRYSREHQFDNRSVWCSDILKLLKHIRGRITSDRVA